MSQVSIRTPHHNQNSCIDRPQPNSVAGRLTPVWSRRKASVCPSCVRRTRELAHTTAPTPTLDLEGLIEAFRPKDAVALIDSEPARAIGMPCHLFPRSNRGLQGAGTCPQRSNGRVRGTVSDDASVLFPSRLGRSNAWDGWVCRTLAPIDRRTHRSIDNYRHTGQRRRGPELTQGVGRSVVGCSRHSARLDGRSLSPLALLFFIPTARTCAHAAARKHGGPAALRVARGGACVSVGRGACVSSVSVLVGSID